MGQAYTLHASSYLVKATSQLPEFRGAGRRFRPVLDEGPHDQLAWACVKRLTSRGCTTLHPHSVLQGLRLGGTAVDWHIEEVAQQRQVIRLFL